SGSINVLAGPPASLRARLSPEANNPPDRNVITVTVTDKYGNPVSGLTVGVSPVAAEMERTLVTDSSGSASCEVIWDDDPGKCSLTLRAGAAPAQIVKH
ncbi:MAG TPA: Ig-like domain-containing protein, partial [Chthonomonadales bacterium]|nr:Ig-like domain-containing protein [Chthonomonadales bacterium]